MIEVITNGNEFLVSVDNNNFVVTLQEETFQKLGRNRTKEEFVKACFEFLLKKESVSSIMPSFDISIIGRFFSDFERKI